MGCAESTGDRPSGEYIDEELERELAIDKRYERKETRPLENTFEIQEATQEQFMATKPWIGAIVPPTNPPIPDSSAPTKELTLQFINGFKVEDSRQNIYFTSKPNTIVYPAAAVGVVMDTTTLKQKFMGAGNVKTANGHTDDIMCLAIDPQRKLAATGSLGAEPLILLWDVNTMEIKGRAKLGRNTRAVCAIRFSKDGKLLFCVDKHNDSNVYCYKVDGMQLLAKNSCGADPVIDAETGTNNKFACATKSGIWVFQLQNGQLTKQRGIFAGNPSAPMTSVTFSEDDNCFISGSAGGNLYYWDENRNCIKVKPMHAGAVTALQWVEGVIYSCGATDKILKLSDFSGVVSRSVELPAFAKSVDAVGPNIVVGTKDGRIMTVEGQTKKEVMRGHYCGETWGLAYSDGLIYTSGDDNNLLVFNPKTSKVEKSSVINHIPGKKYKIGGASTLALTPPNQQSRALAVNKAGHLVVASNDGAISIRTNKDPTTPIFTANDAKQWIEVLRYSPDEKMLAVGSHDNNIYIYAVDGNNYKLQGTLKGHNSFITGLDWSKDGKHMQSVCGAYELLFWDILTLKQETKGATLLRDEIWATLTTKLGWWTQGIFPPAVDGSHVNGVDRTKDGRMIVVADDWGLVNLYKNPCLKGGKANSFRGHSSHVVRAIFDDKDTYVYSVGGFDKTLMVWKMS